MKTSKKNIIGKRRPTGSAIAYGLIIVAIISVIITSLMQYISSQLKYGFYIASREQTFQIAESGIHYYRWYLAHSTDGKSIQEVRDFWNSTDPYPKGLPENPLESEYFDKDGVALGRYKVEVTEKPADNTTVVDVVSSGWTYKHPQTVKKIKVRFRRSSWSDYAVLTNEYSHFDSKWDITGRIMSNTGVHFDGVSYNTVSAGQSSYYDPEEETQKPGVWTSWPGEYNTDRSSYVFLSGKRFPVVQKDFNGVTVNLNLIKQFAMQPGGTTINNCTASGCYFDNQGLGRHLKFRDDGKFEISIIESLFNNSNEIKKEQNGSLQIFNIPQEGVIFVGSNVWIEGKINSNRVTVVSAIIPNTGTNANIYIGADNIEYTNTDGSDVIGLIAQGDFQFSSASKNDLVINAAILAQNGRVWKKDYNPNCCGIGCEENKNSISIFGSVASNKSLQFTSVKECDNAKAVGFQNKKIEYDINLLYFPPPFFPSDTYYVFDLWEEI